MTKDEERALLVLEEAPNVIKEYGWHQGDYGSKTVGFCLMGAVCEAAHRVRVPNTKRSQQIAFAHIAMAIWGSEEGSLGAWNDSATTTRRKVLALLNKVAKQYRTEVTA